MNRGDVVTVALQGDLGKPRPALVVQSDLFNPTHPSVTVAPITSILIDAPLFRVTIEPSRDNGLRAVSQVMVDKLVSTRRGQIGAVVGSLSPEAMMRINRALALWLGMTA